MLRRFDHVMTIHKQDTPPSTAEGGSLFTAAGGGVQRAGTRPPPPLLPMLREPKSDNKD